jgi:hypothetical protein
MLRLTGQLMAMLIAILLVTLGTAVQANGPPRRPTRTGQVQVPQPEPYRRKGCSTPTARWTCPAASRGRWTCAAGK